MELNVLGPKSGADIFFAFFLLPFKARRKHVFQNKNLLSLSSIAPY